MAGRYTNENTYRSVLCVEYSGIIANFESKGADQNEFLINDALEYAKLNLGITHLLFEKGTDKLLSFITLGMGTLKIPDEIDWDDILMHIKVFLFENTSLIFLYFFI